jgi:hypothetical protein
LQYAQQDIYSAFRAWKEGRADRHAAAIEFLDNLLEKPLKPLILPLIEESSVDAQLASAETQLGIKPVGRDDALRRLLAMPDLWLKTCALYEIGENRIIALVNECRSLADAPDPLVKETAMWAAGRLE